MIVAALVWDPTARARLQEALRAQASLRFCERQEELAALVANDLVSVVVVDVRDRESTSTLATVRRIRAGYPSVPVVLYCGLGPDTSREVLDFARAGVNDLVIRGLDDLRLPLRAAITAAQDHCSAKSVLKELENSIPAGVLPIVQYCLENGRRGLTVAHVATAMGVHRKTLVDRLSAAGFPSPSAVISWCRLLVAARLLEDPGRSIEQVALVLDFPSGTSMRNMVKRYTGLRPVEVRENGGLRCILHAFKREIGAVGVGGGRGATGEERSR
jgi:AraC-like DNA-binding protein